MTNASYRNNTNFLKKKHTIPKLLNDSVFLFTLFDIINF